MKPSPSAELRPSLPSACSTRDLVRRLDQTRAIGDASGGEGCHITVGRLIRTDTPVHRQRDWAGDCPPHHALPTSGSPAPAPHLQVVSLEGPRTARVAPGARRLAPPGAPSEDEA